MNDLGRNGEEKQNKQSILTRETFGVVLILFATLCLVCLITGDMVFSAPGLWVSSFFAGCFGYMAYAVTIGLIVLGVELLTDKKINIAKRYKVFITCIFIALTCLVNIITMSAKGGSTLSFGDYISTAYSMAENGVVGSSFGGIVISLISYWISLILTDVGAYVVLGIVSSLLLFFLARDIKKNNEKVGNSAGLKGSFAKVENTPNIAVAGEVDYPVSNVVFNESKENNSKLFVASGEPFSFKTKKELNKEEQTGDGAIKIDFLKNGLGVANAGSYTDNFGEDMKKKIEYIKTPIVIDVNKTINQDLHNRTTVSDYIPKGQDFSHNQNENPNVIEKKEEKEIPFFNHDNIENKSEEQSHAEKFSGYANTEEVDSKNIESSEETFRPVRFDSEENVANFDDKENAYLDNEEIDSDFSNINEEENGNNFYQEETENTINEVETYNEQEEINDEFVEDSFIEKDDRVRNMFSDERKEEIREEHRDFISNVEKDNNVESRKQIHNPVGFGDSSFIEEKKIEKPQPPIHVEYNRPSMDLLSDYTVPIDQPKEDHEGRISAINKTLDDFHINAAVESYIQGPSITRYEIKMAPGVSVKRVVAQESDIAMWLASENSIRIEAPIPGKQLVGIEVANKFPVTVGLKEVLEKSAENPKKGSLIFAVGKDIVGKPIVDDLAEGPHYLVAGATGSGKSVCLNIMIVSLIMRYSPEELRLVLIDPKGNEFRPYEHIPHLMIDEIITEPKKALAVLAWAHDEMEKRYLMLAEAGGLRNINAYNLSRKENERKMPRIVVIVDELSNLMESCKKEMEARILAIAQKARAVGIHLVLATQRPSVDVITGTIKANLPSRIALKVTNFADSNTILAEGGAEKLLGHGDMLYRNSTMSECVRYQGAWISDDEINNVVQYINGHNQSYFNDEMQEYLDKAVKPKEEDVDVSSGDDEDSGVSDLFLKALWYGVNAGSISISYLERKFSIGFSKAGRLVDKMEEMGYVSPNEGSRARRVLLTKEEFEARYGTMSDNY